MLHQHRGRLRGGRRGDRGDPWRHGRCARARRDQGDGTSARRAGAPRAIFAETVVGSRACARVRAGHRRSVEYALAQYALHRILRGFLRVCVDRVAGRDCGPGSARHARAATLGEAVRGQSGRTRIVATAALSPSRADRAARGLFDGETRPARGDRAARCRLRYRNRPICRAPASPDDHFRQ